jgi:hypothetical protein
VPDRSRLSAEALAIAAVAICCALPAVAIVVAGVVASGWGAALRLWPVSVAGLLLLSLGGVTLVRRIRGRTNKPLDREEPSR